MKTVLSFLTILLLWGCQNSREKAIFKPANKKLRLMKVVSDNEFKNASLVISNDTLMFFRPSDSKTKTPYVITKFYYDTKNREFRIRNNINSPNFYSQTDTRVANPDTSEIFYNQIGNLNIKYFKIPLELKNKKLLKGVLDDSTKAQVFNGIYYFVDYYLPQTFYIYYPKIDSLASYNIQGEFMEITDFLLYDFDKDENPEIIIFNLGKVARDYMISYDIYSIRKDSVSVNIY